MANGAFNSCFHFLVVVTLHQKMESKGNWVENLNSQVCVYQIERTVQRTGQEGKKKWFQQKDQKKKNNNLFFCLL